MSRRGRIQSEMGQFLTAKLPTAILQYPTGRFGIVGSVPVELAYRSAEDTRPRTWDSEQAVIDALLGIGMTHFQRADCSWYDKGGSNGT